MSFKPKRIVELAHGQPPPRPSSAVLAAALAPVPPAPPPIAAPLPAVPPARPLAEPVLMMSFKASKPFAKMLAEAAEKEGGLRRLVARVFSEAGYPVPQSELQPQKRRRTYD